MEKKILIVVTSAVLLFGCGKKSDIKNHVQAEKLACAYGDCRHIIRNVTFPLDNTALAFKTPLPGLGPIAGGLLRFMGDTIVKNTKKGKFHWSYIQPIPQVPDELYSVRLKRFFFYMKPLDKSNFTFRESVTSWLRRYVLGEGYTTFAFLDKFALRLSTAHLEEPKTYVPSITSNHSNEEAELSLMRVFTDDYRRQVIDPEVAEELILLKYHDRTKNADTLRKAYGKIHYMETTKDPALVKNFLLSQKEFLGHYKRILILEKSLLIELNKDPLSDEIFKNIMNQYAEHMDKKLGVNFIDTCTEKSCLEVNVPNVNIVPIARKGNSLKLDAVLHAGSVPESFQLKGFVEFEVKFDSKV